MRSFDLLVIGTGPAGIQAALRARQAGRKAAVIERRTMVGGSCIHLGTIPSKTLRQAVIDLSGFRHWGLYSGGPEKRPRLEMKKLRDRCNRVIASEVRFQDRLLKTRQIEAFNGEARFLDPHTVLVHGADGDEEVRGDRILVSVGSTPMHPAHIRFDGTRILDSDQVLFIPDLPRSLAVVGGGVIGSEYAAIFSLLDVDVTLVNRAPHLMPFVDSTIIHELESQLAEREVRFVMGADLESVVHAEDGVRLTMRDGRTVDTDACLYCAGRKGAAEGLDLEPAGLTANKYGCLDVDEDFRTEVPHIYAAGDVIGFPSLASVSREQGRVAACRALGVPCRPVETLLPYGIWTIPELAMVGPTEQQALAEGVDVATGIGRYQDTARGQIIGDCSGLLKLVVRREDRRIIGAHIIGTGGAELIHLAQLAIEHEATYLTFVRQVMNYPTLSRAYKVAAWDLLEQLGD